MKKSMGAVDKTIRILAAFVIAALYFFQVILGMVTIILLIIAGIFILTSLMSFCPLYLPFGISTGKKQQR